MRWKAVGWLRYAISLVLVFLIFNVVTRVNFLSLEPLPQSKEFLTPTTTAGTRTVNINKDMPKNQEETCLPVKKIGFLKTHKCGSTTLQNIILRRAMINRLNIVLPGQGNYAMNPTQVINNTPWGRAGMEYDIWCLHTVWNHREISDIIGPSAFYFTILRDPVDLFVSLWDYYGFGSVFNLTLDEYARRDKVGDLEDRKNTNHLGRNQMLFDMGFPTAAMDNITAVREKIAEVERNFNLVLIAEDFERSVVLLRRALCWKFSDMAYLKLNMRDDKKKTEVSIETRNHLRSWLWADNMLYEHFRDKFRSSIEAAVGLEDDLAKLAEANREVRQQCVNETVDSSKLEGIYKLWGKGLVGYAINEEDKFCKFYSISENSFLDHLRRLQRKRAHRKRKKNKAFQQKTP